MQGLCPVHARDCALYGLGTVPRIGQGLCPIWAEDFAPSWYVWSEAVPHMDRTVLHPCPAPCPPLCPQGRPRAPQRPEGGQEAAGAMHTHVCTGVHGVCHGGLIPAVAGGRRDVLSRGRGFYGNPVLDVPGNPPKRASQTGLNPLTAPGPNGQS